MLRVDETTEYLVSRDGRERRRARSRGWSAIATPDIGVVLKVGLAHAGEFGGIEATQRAKSEMVTRPARDPPSRCSTPTTVARRGDGRDDRGPGRVVRAVVRAPRCAPTTCEPRHPEPASPCIVDGARHEVALRILGEHHVSNALAALAVARELGVPTRPRRSRRSRPCRAPSAGAWSCSQPGGGITVINDAYNASPDSTAAALKTLAQILEPGQRSVAVLGEMAELGEYAAGGARPASAGSSCGSTSASSSWSASGARHIHAAAGLEGSWDGESVLVPDLDAAYDLLRERTRGRATSCS